MNCFELLLLSLALSADLFSVAIPLGMKPTSRLFRLKVAVLFAGTHILMVLTGYYSGHWLGCRLEQTSYQLLAGVPLERWPVFGGGAVLSGLGLAMLSKCGTDATEPRTGCLTRWTLAMLALSVSVDALTAGFSMGMLDVDLWALSGVLGLTVFSIALLGLTVGRQVGRYIGKPAEQAGGMILLLLGLHTLWSAI